MKRKSSAGLSGVIAAILVTAVIVAGIAATNYVAATSSAQNRQMMEELRRQAFKNQELVRIYIHAQNSSDIDSPPRITFVNAWGWPSNITKLLAVYKQGSQRQVIEINRQIIIPPGSRVTISPQDLGLSYASFRQLADNLTALIAYTDAGNSFGSTWGYPREDNLLGATTIITYNTTTTKVIHVPSVTTVNGTITLNRTITLNPPRPIEKVTIRAINYFELTRLHIKSFEPPTDWCDPFYYDCSSYLSFESTSNPGDWPGTPLPSGSAYINLLYNIRKYHIPSTGYDYAISHPRRYNSPYVYPEYREYRGVTQFAPFSGSSYEVVKGDFVLIYNAQRYVATINMVWGSNGATRVLCTVQYTLKRVEITPAPDNFPPPSAGRPRAEAVDMNYDGYRFTATIINGFTADLYSNGAAIGGISVQPPTRVTTITRTAGGKVWTAIVSPIQPPQENILRYIRFRISGDTVVHRYFYIDTVQCNHYSVSPPSSSDSAPGMVFGDIDPDPPPKCNVVVINSSSGGGSGGSGGSGSGGGGGGGSGAVIKSIFSYRVIC